jgi:DNA-binding transcriptional ArsR family regulator
MSHPTTVASGDETALEAAAAWSARLDERLQAADDDTRATWLARAAFDEGLAVASLDGRSVDPIQMLRWLRHDIGGPVSRTVGFMIAEAAMVVAARLDRPSALDDPSRLVEILSREDGILGRLPDVAAWQAGLSDPAPSLLVWSLDQARAWTEGGGSPATARLLLRPLLRRCGLVRHPPFPQGPGLSLDGLARGARHGLDGLAGLDRLRTTLLAAAPPARASSRMPAVVEAILREPLVGAARIAAATGMSHQNAMAALRRLAAAGLVEEITGRGSSRLYLCARAL